MATIRPRNDPALFILFVSAVFGVWGVYQKDRESMVLRAQAQAQLSDLSERQSQLNADISTLQTERGMEAALRQQYALAAQGEDMIIIVDATSATPVEEATSSAFVQWMRKTFPWW